MNELTIVSGDEASPSIGTLIGILEGGSHLLGTLRERCRRKLWRQAPLAAGVRWGTCGVH